MTLTEILLLIYLIVYLYNNNFSSFKKTLKSSFKLFSIKWWKKFIYEREERLMRKKINKLPKKFFNYLNDPNCIFVNKGPIFEIDVFQKNKSINRIRMCIDDHIKEKFSLDNIGLTDYYKEIKKLFPNFKEKIYQYIESQNGQPFYWFLFNDINIDVQKETLNDDGVPIRISPVLHIRFRFTILNEIEAYKIEKIEVVED